jgi:hypothetical protein
MNSKYLAFFGIVVLVMVGLAWVVGAGVGDLERFINIGT